MNSFFLVLLFAVSCFAACGNDLWSIELESSKSTSQQNYDASISGSAGSYSISIIGNSGSVAQGSRSTNVVVNWQIPWGSDVTLYAFIGADETGIMMGWAYCHGNTLTDVWLEDTTGLSGFTNPKVTGTCNIKNSGKSVQLSTTERCYAINQPPTWPTISGPSLSLQNGQPGSITLQGASYNILPFAVVSCTDCHSSLLDGGWIEIHAVMKSNDNVCLGIFYLQIKPKDNIPLNYVNCFFHEIDDTSFPAKYDIGGSLSSMNPTLTTRLATTMGGSGSSAIATLAAAASSTSADPAAASTTTNSASRAGPTNVSSGSPTPTIVQASISSSAKPTAATTSTMQDLIGPPVTAASPSGTASAVSGSQSTTVLVVTTRTQSDAAAAASATRSSSSGAAASSVMAIQWISPRTWAALTALWILLQVL